MRRKQLDVSLNKAKIFPFCSVYNLFLLAKLKIKQKHVRKQMSQKHKSEAHAHEVKGTESPTEPTKSSEAASLDIDSKFPPNYQNRIGRWTNQEIN